MNILQERLMDALFYFYKRLFSKSLLLFVHWSVVGMQLVNVLFSNSSLNKKQAYHSKIPKFRYFLACKATKYAKRAL
ncbi:hypothetical protein AS034_10790 [[Bacillus] enclensis]|nr:hypothetical protein AS034_10790 [[Bacillus] enclensis]